MAIEIKMIPVEVMLTGIETLKKCYEENKSTITSAMFETAIRTLKMVDELVRSSPTVDAVEVVHGHKVVKERIRGIAYTMHCPICNAPIPSNKPYTEKVEYCSVCGKRLDDTFQNYCPNCGAKMDGERKEQ